MLHATWQVEFIGNKKALNILNRSLNKGMLNHAYIFSGPESVGKFNLAKKFALAAIGGRNNIEWDLNEKDDLLDLMVVEPEIVEKNNVAKQRDINIETIRESLQKLSLFPYKGKYKVFIIRDAHRLNIAAQNALLKTLEEPNATSMLILVTHELDRILPTILSRCHMINLSLLSDEEMNVFGENSSLAIGRPGVANILENDIEEINVRKIASQNLEKILYGSINEKFSLAEEYSKDVVKAIRMMDIWIWELRKKASILNDSSRAQLYAKMERIQQSSALLKRTNANSRLILETLFMDL